MGNKFLGPQRETSFAGNEAPRLVFRIESNLVGNTPSKLGKRNLTKGGYMITLIAATCQ